MRNDVEFGKLHAISHLIYPCDVPDVWDGYDQCPCGWGTWPCDKTRAAWLARGLDPATEQQRIMADQRRIMRNHGVGDW
jgi:hypothetical protein